MADYRDDDDDDDAVANKQWAQKYILDPLTCPEPNQECGPGSSFCNPKRTLSTRPRPPPARRAEANPGNHHLIDSSGYLRVPVDEHRHRRPLKPLPQPQLRRDPPSASLNRNKSSATEEPRWSQGTILARSSSISSPPAGNSPVATMMPGADANAPAEATNGLRRAGSLSARYPGDMSHRPLDIIKKEHRAADRAYTHKTRRKHTRKQPSDTIDSLDLSSPVPGTYHHDGPYDATMASRNTDKRYSPLSALKYSNQEALKATPKEYIQDSLTKHVPLQGTAVLPPGARDMSGHTMTYEEGADLMREPDAPGGAYKRYDFIPYHADDLKGKGEPSFTIERDLKEQKARFRKHGTSESADGIAYEMLPGTNASPKDNGTQVRQRSVSNGEGGPSHHRATAMATSGFATNNDVRRSTSSGNRFAEGIKRRFGSLRRKERSSDEAD